MGFARKSLLSFCWYTQRPSPELLVRVWDSTLFSMQCGTVWKRDKHKLIVRKKTWKGQKQNLICEEKDFGRKQTKN